MLDYAGWLRYLSPSKLRELITTFLSAAVLRKVAFRSAQLMHVAPIIADTFKRIGWFVSENLSHYNKLRLPAILGYL